MNFKQVEWEKRSDGYYVANVAFGIQLTAGKSFDKWIWGMGNLSFAFKQGKCKNEQMAKANAEHAFYVYVEENLAKCCD